MIIKFIKLRFVSCIVYNNIFYFVINLVMTFLNYSIFQSKMILY